MASFHTVKAQVEQMWARIVPDGLYATCVEHPLFALMAVVGIVSLFVFLLRKLSNHESMASKSNLFAANRNIKDVHSKATNYSDLFSDEQSDRRKAEYQKLVDQYYDLSTDFYEFGWGESFHFGPRYEGESLDESLRRHEWFLASRLGLKEGMKALDCGCGVGGPARNIARFSRANVTGVSLNEYQIQRGNTKTRAQGLADLVELRQANFMDLPFADNTFDRAYAIEATCHAPDRKKCYSELYRVIKPGGYFAAYEWVLTDKYDPNDPYHRELKYGIEVGDGLPELTGPEDCYEALQTAGFEVQDFRDLAVEPGFSPVPWYQPFLNSLKANPMANRIVNFAVRFMEFIHLAPKGSSIMHTHLCEAARTLRAGGELGLFTPMLFFVGRKPLDGEQKEEPAASSAKTKTAKKGSAKSKKSTPKSKKTPRKTPRKSQAAPIEASAGLSDASPEEDSDDDNASVVSTASRYSTRSATRKAREASRRSSSRSATRRRR